jgi:aconitase (EC 4.2.1.3)
MGKNIVEKIIDSHLVSGILKEGKLIGVRVDQVYTQDATGTMCWLEFEAIGLDHVKVPLAVSYVDHNMLQSNFMNADDHLFLRTAASKFGAYFSRPGNGICHQVHLERFAAPGLIALGTDSHTPTGGGMGMIAIGVGGLEAASVMAGMPFEFTMPKVVLINLTGKLRRPYVTAMDVILTLLKMLTVKGGVGKIFEYGGTGVKDLSVTERATITNMGAELGATTSIFPSDENTLKFLKAQGRQHQWIELQADEDAEYSEIIELDLSEIEPMIAQPHSPDNVASVKELKGMKVQQVCIGSCTNSSYKTMKTVASILKDRTVHEEVTLFINPGSKQVYQMLAQDGSVNYMILSGARILECACGPCIGMGGAPGSGHISLRSYNRNFKGRSGTKDAFVYLASPVVCALSTIYGKLTDPFDSEIKIEDIAEPESFFINDNMIISPRKDKNIQIIKGPGIL